MRDLNAALAKIFFEDVSEGMALPELTNPPITHTMLVRYAGASGDFNPLHTDPAVGRKAGLGGPIAHGMLIMGFLGHFASDFLGGPGPLKHFGARFKNMTRPGDVITCSGVITRKFEEDGQRFVKVEIFARDQTGEVKAAGSFTAVLPTRG